MWGRCMIFAPWTPEESDLLARVWPEMGRDCLPLFPGRSISSVRTRAVVMRLRRAGRKRAARIYTKPTQQSEVITGERILFDAEPLVQVKSDRRSAHSCYGFIRSGAVSSIFQLAEKS